MKWEGNEPQRERESETVSPLTEATAGLDAKLAENNPWTPDEVVELQAIALEQRQRQAALDGRRETVSPKSGTDAVHHPAHYTRGIECWDFITSHGLGFLEGNVVKYVTRYRHKNGLEDLLKARQYLERLIKEHGGEPLTRF